MSLFDSVLNNIEINKYKKNNCISIHDSFPRLSYFLPGIQQKRYYIVSGASGSGKSQFTDHTFVFTPFNFHLTNKDIDFEILYYSLELDKETKIKQWITRALYQNFKIMADVNILDSVGKNRLSDDTLFAVKETRKYIEELETKVRIRDSSVNAVSISKDLKSFIRENGTIIKKPLKIKDDDGEEIEVQAFDSYKPNNPNKYLIVILDHSDLIDSVQGQSVKQTVERVSREFVKFRNRYNIIPVLIQQQSAEMENLDHIKAVKLEPSKQGLSNTKLTYNDCDIALGIFQPQKHDIKSYRGYNIVDMGDSYRSINVFKNRYGSSNLNVGACFYGECNYFKELPRSDEMIKYHYDLVKNKAYA